MIFQMIKLQAEAIAAPLMPYPGVNNKFKSMLTVVPPAKL